MNVLNVYKFVIYRRQTITLAGVIEKHRIVFMRKPDNFLVGIFD